MYGSLEKRLKNRCKIDSSGCWISSYAKRSDGYPVINVGKKSVACHRVSYSIYNGKIPEKLCICHTCDNKSCCNPDHLFVGTMQDNVDDMFRKNRQTPAYKKSLPGEKNGRHKLTSKKCEKIRCLYKSGILSFDLAKRFKVHPTTIQRIVKGQSWKTNDIA